MTKYMSRKQVKKILTNIHQRYNTRWFLLTEKKI